MLNSGTERTIDISTLLSRTPWRTTSPNWVPMTWQFCRPRAAPAPRTVVSWRAAQRAPGVLDSLASLQDRVVAVGAEVPDAGVPSVVHQVIERLIAVNSAIRIDVCIGRSRLHL